MVRCVFCKYNRNSYKNVIQWL